MKNLLLRKQNPPTNAFSWVRRPPSQSALEKFTTIIFYLAVKCTPESPENPCVSQCAQGPVARFLLKLVWQNGEDEKGYEENKQKKARRSKFA